ncbi:class I SAM-dependent methyltransferase [Rhodopseudomonas sp. P2A-2r]|uniref:class I SAM-dependent methyltransferase n=1 Tax=Rhodopseudomonas sp. P2A-2r TaxID=2991972 RepID=UPI002234E9EF|nr:class I SAM-dependent methyltransferase [Rhodopseudomonas sp. P2A-2r]UZE48100.1 class I SAM-dependent methyltransferase [Rhodopseudomonas sp. P2A-2r]
MSFKTRWQRACSETIGSDLFWRIAVDHRAQLDELMPLAKTFTRGVVLDAGAGRMAWRSVLRPLATHYISTDYNVEHQDLTFCADLQGAIPLADQSVDTIFCCSVMEHTPEPWRVLPEFYRILRPGGHVVLSVPFMYYLHGWPHDYFRFTRFGLTRLAEQAGFTVVRQMNGGGIVLMACQAISMAITAYLWTPSAPWLSTLSTSALYRVGRFFNRFDVNGLFSQNIHVVLKRA